MAKTFYDWWTEAKHKFEDTAGEKIKGQNNIHERGKKDKREAETRMKKPTAMGKTMGISFRKSVKIGENAKKLDTALLKTGEYVKRENALTAFNAAAESYSKQLDDAEKTPEYKDVKKEIRSLKKAMLAIGTTFGNIIKERNQFALDRIIQARQLPGSIEELEKVLAKSHQAEAWSTALGVAEEDLKKYRLAFSDKFVNSHMALGEAVIIYKSRVIMQKYASLDAKDAAIPGNAIRVFWRALDRFYKVLEESPFQNQDRMLNRVHDEYQFIDKNVFRLVTKVRDGRREVEKVNEDVHKALVGRGLKEFETARKKWFLNLKSAEDEKLAKVKDFQKKLGILAPREKKI